ncbi:MAG: hypothetical protein H6595_06840 [Flavobacteriales bacterium]|nr:hypothetical protein [Flavobacteriales bacterium]MCB9167182.1 hypothetical protein [Flavobacteriales bacterium]
MFLAVVTAWMLLSGGLRLIVVPAKNMRTPADLFTMAIWMIVPISILYLIQRRALRLREFRGTINEDQFQEAVDRTARELEWIVVRNDPKCFQARHQIYGGMAVGQLITILRADHGLLVNSITDPDRWGGVTPFHWNRRNVETFIRHLNKVRRGIPAPLETDATLDEWSPKRALIRAFMYPLCLSLICVSSVAVYYGPSNATGILFAILLAGLALTYLIADVRMILAARAKRPR